MNTGTKGVSVDIIQNISMSLIPWSHDKTLAHVIATNIEKVISATNATAGIYYLIFFHGAEHFNNADPTARGAWQIISTGTKWNKPPQEIKGHSPIFNDLNSIQILYIETISSSEIIRTCWANYLNKGPTKENILTTCLENLFNANNHDFCVMLTDDTMYLNTNNMPWFNKSQGRQLAYFVSKALYIDALQSDVLYPSIYVIYQGDTVFSASGNYNTWEISDTYIMDIDVSGTDLQLGQMVYFGTSSRTTPTGCENTSFQNNAFNQCWNNYKNS